MAEGRNSTDPANGTSLDVTIEPFPLSPVFNPSALLPLPLVSPRSPAADTAALNSPRHG